MFSVSIFSSRNRSANYSKDTNQQSKLAYADETSPPQLKPIDSTISTLSFGDVLKLNCLLAAPERAFCISNGTYGSEPDLLKHVRIQEAEHARNMFGNRVVVPIGVANLRKEY